MALFERKKNKLWIWKVLCRDTGELIAWECGDRDKATLEGLIEKLERWNVKVYYTDDYQAYAAVIPGEKLVRRKQRHMRLNATIAGCDIGSVVLSESLLLFQKALRWWSLTPIFILFCSIVVFVRFMCEKVCLYVVKKSKFFRHVCLVNKRSSSFVHHASMIFLMIVITE